MENLEEIQFPENKQFSEKAIEDFDLIDKAVGGDEKAYAELMNKYRKSVYHTILKMVRNIDDAEDLTIEAFAKAFKNLPKFKKDYTFSTWLFRVATNNCIDFIRKKRLDTYSIDSEFANEEGDSLSIDIRDANLNPQEEVIKTQKVQIIQEIVNLLPTRYKKLVRLRYFEEMSYEEISEEVGAPLGTVKAQLHRARELLFDMVKNKKNVI
ncbi:MAG: RNA polymerase sigma factor SigW [Flammeovirgaceae bacterium]